VAVRALWKLPPPADGVASGGSTAGGATIAGPGPGAGAGSAMPAALRAGSLLAASPARAFSTSQPPPGSGAMRPARCAFCSAVCDTLSRRAASRCEATSPAVSIAAVIV
jgi:hypothetical protein